MEYDVSVHRDGRWWMIEVPEIDGLTQARRVEEIEDMARSLIAITTDESADSITVNVTKVTVGDVDALALAHAVRDARSAAERAESAAADAMRSAVRELVSHDAPMRDVGELLGVSHQRVSQLAH